MVDDVATTWGGKITLGRAPASNEILLGDANGNFALTPSSSISPSIQTLLDGISNTQGSILYRSATAWSALAPGTSGQVLTTNGAGANPAWASASTAGPAFGVYNGSGQIISSGATDQLTFDVEEFDTNNNFASNAFTPTVAGYYQLNAAVYFGGDEYTQIYIYKNGSVFKGGVYADYGLAVTVSSLVYANGSTDVFTIWAYTGSTQTAAAGQSNTYFNGFLARSA